MMKNDLWEQISWGWTKEMDIKPFISKLSQQILYQYKKNAQKGHRPLRLMKGDIITFRKYIPLDFENVFFLQNYYIRNCKVQQCLNKFLWKSACTGILGFHLGKLFCARIRPCVATVLWLQKSQRHIIHRGFQLQSQRTR